MIEYRDDADTTHLPQKYGSYHLRKPRSQKTADEKFTVSTAS